MANSRKMTFQLTHRISILLIISLIAGCSPKASVTGETIKQALLGSQDVDIAPQYIAELPYASSYVTINKSSRIFMVLAFADKNPITGDMQLKWMSADNAMIVTENGRIIKTLNLPKNNISYINPRFKLFNFRTKKTKWLAEYDWQPHYDFAHPARITSYQTGQQMMHSVLWQKLLNVWHEDIEFIQSSKHMNNVFWTDNQGKVWKSKQWLIPEKLFIEQEILKPYLHN